MAARDTRSERVDTAQALGDFYADISLAQGFPYGLQHVLAMFVANLAPIFIVAAAAGMDAEQSSALIQNALLMAGLGTMIQLFPLWRVGGALPIVTGISFTYVSAVVAIVAAQGYGVAVGAIIAGGLIEGALGLTVRYWRRAVPPIVSAVVVTSIGFSLLSVGAESFGGGSGAEDFGSLQNLLLGLISLVACLAFQSLAKGTKKQLAVLFGLVVGYVAALALASGIGFTQVQGIFAAFPPIVQSIFGSNCIAVAFVVAVLANLLLPKEQADEE